MTNDSTEGQTDLAGLPPLRITHRGADTNGTRVRAEAIVRPLPGWAAADVAILPHQRWFEETGIISHIHPIQEETIEVLDGTYMVRIDGIDYRLAAGERTIVPKNTAHAHWNPTDRLARIAVEHRPATHSDLLFEAMYRAAQNGKAMASGLPHPLTAAVIADRFPNVVYMAGLPISLQKKINRAVTRMVKVLGVAHGIDHERESPADPPRDT